MLHKDLWRIYNTNNFLIVSYAHPWRVGCHRDRPHRTSCLVLDWHCRKCPLLPPQGHHKCPPLLHFLSSSVVFPCQQHHHDLHKCRHTNHLHVCRDTVTQLDQLPSHYTATWIHSGSTGALTSAARYWST